jgi:RNA polymerase sigma-70 factor (ECF subfamily)
VESAPPAGESDAGLLVRARSGDRAAFGVLVERHHGALAALVRQRFGPGFPVEDLLQDVFARTLAGLDGFEGRSTFLTWSASVALHLAVDWSRRDARRRRLVPLESPAALDGVEGGDGPAAAAEERDEVRRAREALGRLPDGQRTAVTLRVVESLEYDEVARRLGVEPGVARQWVCRGLKRLREEMSHA